MAAPELQQAVHNEHLLTGMADVIQQAYVDARETGTGYIKVAKIDGLFRMVHLDPANVLELP